ncbi:MAG: hypothetical protein JW774_05485 [Candidatus Aureabacteria bacterium]|nr:hypothetical protein [Candidatus Auribacterota bacterium]
MSILQSFFHKEKLAAPISLFWIIFILLFYFLPGGTYPPFHFQVLDRETGQPLNEGWIKVQLGENREVILSPKDALFILPPKTRENMPADIFFEYLHPDYATATATFRHVIKEQEDYLECFDPIENKVVLTDFNSLRDRQTISWTLTTTRLKKMDAGKLHPDVHNLFPVSLVTAAQKHHLNVDVTSLEKKWGDTITAWDLSPEKTKEWTEQLHDSIDFTLRWDTHLKNEYRPKYPLWITFFIIFGFLIVMSKVIQEKPEY